MADPLVPIIQKACDLQKAFDFNVAVYGYVNRFPRAHKGFLGREILRLALDRVVLLVTANHHANTVPELEDSSARLDALRITLRLAHQLHFLSHTGYEVLSQDLAEIGRMLGGWLKESAGRGAAAVAEEAVAKIAQPKEHGKQPKRPAVRYTLTSPKVEAYLHAKLAHPENIVFVKTGIFYRTFFEDAQFCHDQLCLQLQNLAAASAEGAIPSGGFPVTAVEKYTARLADVGKAVYCLDS